MLLSMSKYIFVFRLPYILIIPHFHFFQDRFQTMTFCVLMEVRIQLLVHIVLMLLIIILLKKAGAKDIHRLNALTSYSCLLYRQNSVNFNLRNEDNCVFKFVFLTF